MKLPRETRRGAGDRRGVWLWMLSLFLLGLGARLWLIGRFGTPLPFWDQWEEARVVYIPFFAGKLSLADLFSAHNEHRIFFTRIYGLGLLLLNGQWDNQVQMVVNAILHCTTITGLGWLMCRWLERKHWILVWLPLVLVLGLPFGWENSLAGFQSQFYFLVLAVQADPAATHGFVTNGFHLARREPATEVSWGSYSKDRAAAKGRFESLPVSKSKLPFLEFRVAGDLGKPGLSLTLLHLSSAKMTAVKPRPAPGDHWQSYQVRAPHGAFKIIASDESDSGWFAFQAPREVGRLSWVAGRLASLGGSLFFTGVGIYLVGLAFAFRGRPGRDYLRRASDGETQSTLNS